MKEKDTTLEEHIRGTMRKRREEMVKLKERYLILKRLQDADRASLRRLTGE